MSTQPEMRAGQGNHSGLPLQVQSNRRIHYLQHPLLKQKTGLVTWVLPGTSSDMDPVHHAPHRHRSPAFVGADLRVCPTRCCSGQPQLEECCAKGCPYRFIPSTSSGMGPVHRAPHRHRSPAFVGADLRVCPTRCCSGQPQRVAPTGLFQAHHPTWVPSTMRHIGIAHRHS